MRDRGGFINSLSQQNVCGQLKSQR